jgi:O-antigen/teichoic acid export membrane protein
MNRLKRNMIANFVGNGVSAFANILFTPVYLKYLDAESYGLIGISATMQVIAGLMTLGLSSTLTRELSRLSGAGADPTEQRDLVRTLEIAYWSLCLVVGLVAFLASGWVAQRWVIRQGLSLETVHRSLVLIGATLPLGLAASFYQGGLIGLQHQVLQNIVRSAITAVRVLGSCAVLLWYSPTIQAFLAWQVVVGILQVIVYAGMLWHGIPQSTGRPRFQKRILSNLARYSLGMAGTAVAATVTSQLDKVVLSKVLPLTEMGYYTLAGLLAGGITILVGPLQTALFPRLAQLAAQPANPTLGGLYHKSCQVVSFLVLPIGLVTVAFSREVLVAWTNNPRIAQEAHLVTSILVLGSVCNALATIPYALQIAHGWTSLGFYTNLVAMVLLVPLLLVLTKIYGAVGAASVWLILNSGYLLVFVRMMHRRLLPGEQSEWYLKDVGLPALATLSVVLLCRWTTTVPSSRPAAIFQLGVIWVLVSAACGLASPSVREVLVTRKLGLR